MHPLIRRMAAALVLNLAAWPAFAGSYSANPVKIELSMAHPATTLRVNNTDSQPLTIQVEVKKWSQENGEEVLVDSRELIAVPPIFTLPQGKQQIVRVGLRSKSTIDQELAYRIILREIPADQQGKGLNIALAMSIPAFVAPSQAVQPEIKWQATRLNDKQLRISASNTGNTHYKFDAWEILEDGKSLESKAQLQYLLPGATKQWTISPERLPASGDALDIHVSSAGRKTTTRTVVK